MLSGDLLYGKFFIMFAKDVINKPNLQSFKFWLEFVQ